MKRKWFIHDKDYCTYVRRLGSDKVIVVPYDSYRRLYIKVGAALNKALWFVDIRKRTAISNKIRGVFMPRPKRLYGKAWGEVH